MYRRIAAAAALLVLALAPQSAQGANPAPNVLVSRDRTEPVVAVDPLHPDTVVVATNTNYDAPIGGTYPDGAFASDNGGRSFRSGHAPIVRPWTTEADPSLWIAGSGTAFLTYLAESPAYCSSGGAAVILSRSFDHGRTFGSPVVVDNNSNDDKPFSAVESIPGERAHVFVTWTRQVASNSEAVMFARSTDGGASFGAPTVLRESGGNNFGAVPAVGPRGHVYVAWSSYQLGGLEQFGKATVWIRASTDDGRHFGPLHAVARDVPTLAPMAMPGNARNEPFPALTVTSAEQVFVAWTQLTRQLGNGAGYANILASRSANGGRSWSKPVRLNDTSRGDRFMPSITPTGPRSIASAFYDRRNGPWQLDVYAAFLSFHHGPHVSRNVRITSGTSPLGDVVYYRPGQSSCFYPGRFFGDYIGTAAANSTLCIVWADTQKHVYGRTDIWYARIPIPPAR